MNWWPLYLVIPPLVTLWPALAGARFIVVATTAGLASLVVWAVALYVVYEPPDDSELYALPLVILPFYAVPHALVTLAIVGIPWALLAERRERRAGPPVP